MIRVICWSKPRSAHAGMVTLLNITFNLFAQTSQLAARINLGSPQVWDTEDEGNRKKTKHGGQRERATTRKGKNRSRCDEKEAKESAGRSRAETRNNRPITWVTGADRSREPGNRSLRDGSQCDESGETDSQSQGAPPTWTSAHSSFSSSFSSRGPSRCRFCCCRCCLDGAAARSDELGRHHPVAASVPAHLPPPLPHAGHLRVLPVTSTFLVPVDERSLALSFPTFIRVN
ncbi:hypothetical protein DBV15_10632 [Temnothorax longispinosus]|uniref:Uncharacterized protein n=1 Tax=Temnothorax longispinosus TaxID=300112 RepID=A0A4S2KF88_9HYME|nr:hypothetical protein DBV15_10632 [Temnothorax longispinosus]